MNYSAINSTQPTALTIDFMLPINHMALVVTAEMQGNIYVGDKRLVSTRKECYECLHIVTLTDVKMLLLRKFIFININGSVHANVPDWVVRQVIYYLISHAKRIEEHPDYPSHPTWKPNLTKRQIDAIIAKQHSQRKEEAKQTMGTTGTTKSPRQRKPRAYPIEMHTFAEYGYWTYGHHDKQDFINALSEYLEAPIEAVQDLTQEYGYHVPAAHYSDYPTVWYPCDGPQRGARPITMCYDVIYKKAAE